MATNKQWDELQPATTSCMVLCMQTIPLSHTHHQTHPIAKVIMDDVFHSSTHTSKLNANARLAQPHHHQHLKTCIYKLISLGQPRITPGWDLKHCLKPSKPMQQFFFCNLLISTSFFESVLLRHLFRVDCSAPLMTTFLDVGNVWPLPSWIIFGLILIMSVSILTLCNCHKTSNINGETCWIFICSL